MAVTTINTKVKSNENFKKLDSRVFHDKPAISSRRSTTNSIVAQSRIGLPIKKDDIVVKKIIEDDTVGGIKIGDITILGDPNENNVDFFRYGKDVKSIKNLLNDRLTPNVTLGKENDITSDDHIDHNFELTSYGQNSLFKTFDVINRKFIPFDDFEGKPPVTFFIGKKPEEKKGYPYVHDEKRNYDKFRDPDPAALDGAIEVFHVRNSPANTGFLDLQIKGARGLFGVGSWELTQHTTYGKKGSPFVSEKYEVKQSSHDYFEDADESILEKPVEGFISDGFYKSSPFVEKVDYFDNKYEHLTLNQRTSLLLSSSRSDSELGTRFKSRDNGFIMNPFYKLVEQRTFGTDSIAFSGLLKG